MKHNLRTAHALAAVALVSVLGAAGCGSKSVHSPEEKYYLVATNIKVPYWQTAFAGLSQASKDMGVPAELVGPDTYDPKAQHDSFQHILGKKPSGILVSVADPAIMGPDIDSALAQGIPVITIDSDASSSKRLMFLGTDNYKAGMIGGQLTSKILKGHGQVVLFTIPQQPNLAQRMHGYQDAFASSPGIKILKVVDIKGDPRVAFDTTEEMIRSKAKVDAFVCLEAIACPEVADVVNRENMGGKVNIIAMDTDTRTLDFIKKGVINATIAQKPYTMAYFGLKLLDEAHHHPPSSLTTDWAQNLSSPFPSFIDTGSTLVDKSNVDAISAGQSTAK